MELTEIDDPAQLEEGLARSAFLLFKHSRTCPTSAFAFAEYRAFVQAHPEVPTGWLDVIARRDLSQRVAATTGVRHESPQALLFRDGSVAWHASHGAITAARLDDALASRATDG